MPARICEEPGCRVSASFNNPERVIPRFCGMHRGPRMVNVRTRKCCYDQQCKGQPHYADRRSPGAATACLHHATVQMVFVSKKARSDAWAAEAEQMPQPRFRGNGSSDTTSDCEDDEHDYAGDSDYVELVDREGNYVGGD